MSAISASINRLRELAPVTSKVPTVAQLAVLAEDIYNVVPLETTVNRPDMAGFTPVELCEIAEEFGKFRSRSHKGNEKAATRLDDETGFLFDPPTRAEILHMRDAASRYMARPANGRWRKPGDPTTSQIRHWIATVDQSYLSSTPDVIIPPGYGPLALGRNIRASLAALVNTLPSPEETERFWVRRYTSPTPELTADHVYMVWWVASNGRGDKLDQLDGTTSYLNGLLVRAHDLLETHLGNARSAAATLIRPGAHTGDIDDITSAVTELSWADQGLFDWVNAAVEPLVAAPDNERLRKVLATRLGTVSRWVTSSSRTLRDIGALNQGQLMTLCRRSGLEIDSVEEKKAREEIRARLTEYGLAADLDREMPEALTAWRAGRLEEFYNSRAARALGDAGWADLFNIDDVEV